MRRILVALTLAPLFALALPACLSGFSEIRIARSDAGSVDVARLDVSPLDGAADAPQSPQDALDAPTAPDVPAPPLDAPEVAVSVDVATDLDAQDAGAVLADVQDASAEDHVDAGELVDRVDVVTATDVVDVFDVQCPTPLCNGQCVDTNADTSHCGRCGNSCGSGARCEQGRCGSWRFRGLIQISGGFGTPEGLAGSLAARCAQHDAGVPCPGEPSLVLAAAASASADGGSCRWINTREIVMSTTQYRPACWSCVGLPQPPSGCGDPWLACCVFE